MARVGPAYQPSLSAVAMRASAARARRREHTLTSGAPARQSETACGDHAAQHFAGTTVDRRRRRMAIGLLDQTQTFLAAYQRLRRGKIEQIGRVDDERFGRIDLRDRKSVV